MRRISILLVLAACTDPVLPPVLPVAKPTEGISIAVYTAGEAGFGVVDDRRRVLVKDGVITLDRIDPAAALPSLVIEPLGDKDLTIGACVRERVDTSAGSLERLAQRREPARTDPDVSAVLQLASVLSPTVRCAATGASGERLVRVLYVAPSLRFRGHHDITVTADAATIATRFTFKTPEWKATAHVTLFEGLPGGEDPPRMLIDANVALDGGTAQLALPSRTAKPKLVTIFDGGISDEAMPITDPAWNRESRRTVMTWVELADTRLPEGPARVHVAIPGTEAHDVIVTAKDFARVGKALRIPIATETTLTGNRRHVFDHLGDRGFSQRFELAVTNSGTAPREVWIEERLRPLRGRKITQAWPDAKPPVTHHAVRVRVIVAPRTTQRLGFTVDYPR